MSSERSFHIDRVDQQVCNLESRHACAAVLKLDHRNLGASSRDATIVECAAVTQHRKTKIADPLFVAVVVESCHRS